jgi:UDP-N-acetylglucosamine 2-epimerase
MTVAALQKKLISRISEIHDSKKLEYLEELLNAKDSFDEDGILIITEPMSELINISKEQIKNDDSKSNDQVMEEAKSWLNERK